jgi:hypothetical protein
MRRLAFKVSSRVAAPFQFLILLLRACEKDPARSGASTQGAGDRRGTPAVTLCGLKSLDFIEDRADGSVFNC